MFKIEDLKTILFFDVECVSEYSSLDNLRLHNPKMAELWEKRCVFLRKLEKYGNENKTDDELYFEKASLHHEFSKPVAVSIGRIIPELSGIKIVVENKGSFDEKELLQEVADAFTLIATKSNNKFVLGGHNIKRFDIPFLVKRLLINGIEIPEMLNVFNKKPWEIKHVDTSEIWSCGVYQDQFTSLDLIATSLGIETPKDDIYGADVNNVYWNENNLERIKTYCGKDVFTVAKVLLKMSNFDLNNVTVVDSNKTK